MRYFEEPTGENPKYPCGTCQKNVNKNHKAVQCDLCNYWTRIKCDKIDNKDYENLKKSNDTYFCNLCKEEAIPLQHSQSNNFSLRLLKVLLKTLVKTPVLTFFQQIVINLFLKN